MSSISKNWNLEENVFRFLVLFSIFFAQARLKNKYEMKFFGSVWRVCYNRHHTDRPHMLVAYGLLTAIALLYLSLISSG